MMHLFSPAPALDLAVALHPPTSGKIGRLEAPSFSPGGKAVNLARFLKAWRLSYTLTLGAGGGDDPTHAIYAALLRQEGLRASFLDPAAPIRLNLVMRMGMEIGKFNHPGHPLSQRSVEGYGRRILDRPRPGSFWVLSGRVPKGLDGGRLRSWVLALEDRGVRCVVDTSGTPLRSLLTARPSFLKVNRHEMSEALGCRMDGLGGLLRLLPRLQTMGLRHGAVTDGDRGALAWEDAEVAWVRPPRRVSASRVVVGAGDAFLAGYLKAWRDRRPLPERVAWATAAGACVAKDGIAGFDPKKVDRLRRQVTFG